MRLSRLTGSFHSRHGIMLEDVRRRARWRDWEERGTGRQRREKGEILTNHARIFMSCLHMNINKKKSEIFQTNGIARLISFLSSLEYLHVVSLVLSIKSSVLME